MVQLQAVIGFSDVVSVQELGIWQPCSIIICFCTLLLWSLSRFCLVGYVDAELRRWGWRLTAKSPLSVTKVVSSKFLCNFTLGMHSMISLLLRSIFSHLGKLNSAGFWKFTTSIVVVLLWRAVKPSRSLLLGIMSGRGKGGKAKSSAKAKTRSSRAGLQFPVGRIHRLLRKVGYKLLFLC